MDLPLSQYLNFICGTVPAQVLILSLACKIVTISNLGFIIFLIIRNVF